MTFFTDDRLRQAAKEAGAILDGSLPAPEDCPHTFSLPFQAKMAKLLRRHKRAPARRAMRRVACLVLVCLLGSGVFLTTNAQAREAFFGWVSQIVESTVDYTFDGAVSEVKCHYYLPAVPEGYWEVSRYASETSGDELYENASGEYLSFTYLYVTDNSTSMLTLFGIDAMEKANVSVNGISADYYFDDTGEISSSLVWVDPESNALLHLSAYLDKDALIALAETVTRRDVELTYPQLDVPSEYTLYDFLYDQGMTQHTYITPDGQWIEFIYRAELSGEETLLPSSGAKKQDVTIQGIPATLYPSYPEPGRDTLLWTDPETGALVYLSAPKTSTWFPWQRASCPSPTGWSSPIVPDPLPPDLRDFKNF